ncbi:lipid A-modifier LpxR family protein [Geoalkalibacter sp.]|uniref:lipid A-modifier LpxR family protein n=1 Tax=Geoalkalibacter sp. TaxID=3041440 RepID=UPI00272DDCDD|nr:lipid A-modifier LpxR family protein [Geoalkalibacter sp.]
MPAPQDGFGGAHYLPFDVMVFRHSRSVDTELFIGMVSYGVSVRRGRFALGLVATSLTKTFENERENPEFGTVSLS